MSVATKQAVWDDRSLAVDFLSHRCANCRGAEI